MKTLKSLLDKHRITGRLSSSVKLTKILTRHWDDIFGMLSKNLSIGYLRKDTLTIYVKNPIWIQEIGFYEDKFVEKINDVLSEAKVPKIKNIRVLSDFLLSLT